MLDRFHEHESGLRAEFNTILEALVDVNAPYASAAIDTVAAFWVDFSSRRTEYYRIVTASWSTDCNETVGAPTSAPQMPAPQTLAAPTPAPAAPAPLVPAPPTPAPPTLEPPTPGPPTQAPPTLAPATPAPPTPAPPKPPQTKAAAVLQAFVADIDRGVPPMDALRAIAAQGALAARPPRGGLPLPLGSAALPLPPPPMAPPPLVAPQAPLPGPPPLVPPPLVAPLLPLPGPPPAMVVRPTSSLAGAIDNLVDAAALAAARCDAWHDEAADSQDDAPAKVPAGGCWRWPAGGRPALNKYKGAAKVLPAPEADATLQPLATTTKRAGPYPPGRVMPQAFGLPSVLAQKAAPPPIRRRPAAPSRSRTPPTEAPKAAPPTVAPKPPAGPPPAVKLRPRRP